MKFLVGSGLLLIALLCSEVDSWSASYSENAFLQQTDGQVLKVKPLGCQTEWADQSPRRSFVGIELVQVCRDSVWVEYEFRGQCYTVATVIKTRQRYEGRPMVGNTVVCFVDILDGRLVFSRMPTRAERHRF